MTLDPGLAVLAGSAALGYAVQTISGFGTMVITLTLAANVMLISRLVLLLLPLSLGQYTYIMLRHRGAVDTSLLFRWIVPFMGAGTMVGAVVATGVGDSAALKKIFAGLILLLAVRELAVLSGRLGAAKPLGPGGTGVGLALAGLVHGIFVTGGPLLVYTIGRSDLDKSTFRSTLTAVWLIMNGSMVTYFVVSGRYTVRHVVDIAWLAPSVVVGVIVGEILHNRINPRAFRYVIFGFLAVAAATLLLR